MKIYESKDKIVDSRTGLRVHPEICSSCMELLDIDPALFNGPFEMDSTIDECFVCEGEKTDHVQDKNLPEKRPLKNL